MGIRKKKKKSIEEMQLGSSLKNHILREIGGGEDTDADTIQSSSKKALNIPSLEQIEQELQREQYKSRYGSAFMSTVYMLLIVAAVAVIVAVMVFPVLRINGISMTDTLQDGDIVVAMNDSHYKTGQVIAFYYGNNILVKRVIASSGQWVDIDVNGTVYVDGQPLDEPYVTEKALGECNITLPYQVPEEKIFVLGDHRATSVDSRSTTVGCISEEFIIGKIFFCIWPFVDAGSVN